MKYTDALIIGTGIAGLATALHLSEFSEVTLVTKGSLKESSSYWAQGGIAAALTSEDHFDQHIQDTLEAGVHHNNVEAVKVLAEGAPEAISFLKELGIQFSDQPQREGGHSVARVWQTSDFTGQDIMNQLIKVVQKKKNITLLEQSEVVELIVENNRCKGVFLWPHFKEVPEALLAHQVILATGGLGQLYEKTSNPISAAGDGLALALKAGLELKDLEFVQFHPTALNYDDEGRYFLLTETLRGFGARVVNEQGESFLDDCHPKGALAPRDMVTRGIFFEQSHGPVYLKMNDLNAEALQSTFTNIIKRLKQYGFNPFSDPIPITPVAHFSCGGIPTNLKAQTQLKGLYAVGEVACTGVHGANRLGSNALLEALVFAKRLAMDIQQQERISFDESKVYEPPTLIKEEIVQAKAYAKRIARIMWEKVGIVRQEQHLREAMAEINSIPARDYRIQSRQKVCLSIIEAALARPSSLGCHYYAELI